MPPTLADPRDSALGCCIRAVRARARRPATLDVLRVRLTIVLRLARQVVAALFRHAGIRLALFVRSIRGRLVGVSPRLGVGFFLLLVGARFLAAHVALV